MTKYKKLIEQIDKEQDIEELFDDTKAKKASEQRENLKKIVHEKF